MNQITRILITFTVLVCSLQALGADKYTDGNRPYEFGFTIDGEQHRHEKKDENGIIMGEFGFITADGVYHVTVYATDEQGRFKILSMKNIRVKSYPTGLGTIQNQPTSLTPAQKEPAPQRSSPPKITPALPKGVQQSCSHCSLPPTKPPPNNSAAGNRNPPSLAVSPPLGVQGYSNTLGPKNYFGQGGPSSNYPDQGHGQIKQNSQQAGSHRYSDKGRPVSSQLDEIPQGLRGQSGTVQNFKQNSQPFNSGDNYSKSYGLNQSQLDSNTGKFYNPQNSQLFGSSDNYSKSYGSNKSQLDSDQSYNPINSHPFGSGDSYSTRYGSNQSQIRSDTRQSYNPQSSQPFGSGENNSESYGSNQSQPGSSNDQSYNLQTYNNADIQPESQLRENKPTLISAQMRVVDKTTDIHHKNPGEKDGLPVGVTKSDVLRILYTFNYTVGFHGHHEEGYTNGTKVGYYYVTGRNGVRSRIDYVADENGFRPKITMEVLDLISDDVPKPETEKDEKYGLKSYEFKWLYFPVESKS